MSSIYKQTGPKTPEGKQKSSLNALKHGLTAQSPHARDLLANELVVDAEAIASRIHDYYRPADPLEEELVKHIADCLIRLERARMMEHRLHIRRPDGFGPTSSYERVVRYQRSIDIQLHRAMAAISKKRESERIKERSN